MSQIKGMVVIDWGLLYLPLNCIHRQIHIYDAIGTLALNRAVVIDGMSTLSLFPS